MGERKLYGIDTQAEFIPLMGNWYLFVGLENHPNHDVCLMHHHGDAMDKGCKPWRDIVIHHTEKNGNLVCSDCKAPVPLAMFFPRR